MKYLKIAVAALAFAVLFIGHTASAEENEANANSGVQYSVNKVKNEKEIDPESSYFDLQVKPGDELTIQAVIYNAEDKDINVQQEAYTTFTNSNGEISYTSALKPDEYDKSLKVKFSDIAKVDTENPQPVAANGEAKVSMTLKIPDDAKDGVILGSWYFEKKDQVKKDEQAASGISINNKYSYAIGVKITVDKEIEKPNLNLLGAAAGLNNYRKVVNVSIQNDQPAIVSKLTFDASVTKKGSKKVLYKNDKGEVTMAPNSHFDYPLFLGDQKFKPGKYTLHLTAKTSDSKWKAKSWSWDKDFTISSKQANKVNQKAINDPKPKLSIWWVVAAIGLSAIVIILLVYILVSRKYKKEIERLKSK